MKNLYVGLIILLIPCCIFGQANLPLSRTAWGAAPIGWTDNGTQRTTTFACSGSDGGSLQASGKFYKVFFNSSPGQLTYNLKGLNTTGLYKVQESVDGITWTDVAVFTTISGSTCLNQNHTLLASSRYVQFIYITKTTGNVDIDDVMIDDLGSTDLFRSNTVLGNWNTPSSWESSSDGGSTWVPASVSPTSSATGITIRTGHEIVLNTTGISMKATTIQNGGTLKITTSSTYTIADGSGDDLIIESGGILALDFGGSNPSSISGAGSAIVKAGGKVKAITTGSGTDLGNNYLEIGSKFLYENNAIFEWLVTTTTLGSAPGQDYFRTNSITDLPVFLVSATPAFPYGAASGSNNFNCIFEVNATFPFGNSSTKTIRGGIRGTGSVTQTGGAIIFPNATSVLDGSIIITIINNGLQLTNGATVPIGANVKITSSPEDQIINKLSGTLLINGTLDVTDLQIRNTVGTSPSIIVNGTLKTANKEGLFASSAAAPLAPTINSTTVLTLNSGSTIEYNANIAQSISSTPAYSNITFSGSGTKTPANAINATGTVKITGTNIVNFTNRNINGVDFIMDNGRLILGLNSTQPGMTGNYTLTGGIVEFFGSSNQTIRSRSYQNIEVTGGDVRNSNGNITLNPFGTFIVKDGGSFTINDNTITGPIGSQTVTVIDGAFNCGNNKGFNGFTATFFDNSSIHSNIEFINLNSGSTVEYIRTSDQPITNFGGLVYHHLFLSGSGTKTAPADTLKIRGDFVTSGTLFAHNNGTVLFSGITDAQSYSAPSPGHTFNNIAISNSNIVTTSSALKLVKELSLISGGKLFIADTFALLSTISNTANVAAISTADAISYGAAGRFSVERYIPAHNKAWQFLATPVVAEQFVRAAWQEGSLVAKDNLKPGYGTIITSNIAGNGFDIETPLGPTIKFYNPVLDTFDGIITKTDTLVTNPRGYMLFVRGDRSIQVSQPLSNETTLRLRGKIFAPGAFAPPSSTVLAGKFESIGNPYASAIDFTTLSKTNVDDKFYVWDPLLNGAYGLGGYQTIAAPTWIPSPGGTVNYPGTPVNTIQSGQAFFVFNSSDSAGSVAFSETNKVNTNKMVYKPGGIVSSFTTSLFSANGNIADGNMVLFDDAYSNGVDKDDALKRTNLGENFGIATKGKRLAIEARKQLSGSDTIFYNFNNLAQLTYTLKFFPKNITLYGLEAFLLDKFTNQKTPLSLTDSTVISFAVTSNPLSASADRLLVVFQKPVPITYTNIAAVKNGHEVKVTWSVSNETNISNYVIERSANNINFIVLANQLAANSGTNGYMYIDKDPLPGKNYYRIRSLSTLYETRYSEVAFVEYKDPAVLISVYPNPVTADKIININLSKQLKGRYLVNIFNSSGKRVQSYPIQHPGRSGIYALSLAILTRGNYLVTITDPAGKQETYKIVY